MPIQFKSYQTLVNEQVLATQASSSELIDFNVGTVELAIIEANAAMGIWLEYLANAILALARSSTSNGADLDSWMAQFRFVRLPAVPSTGNCTFSRFVTTSTALVPVGSLVKTTDFSLQFMVIADTSNPNFNPSLNAYVMNPSINSTLAKVQCTTPGTIGNVSPNQITFISSPIAGVDTVDNTLAFENGKNQESDNDFRNRFVLYLNSLSRGVLLAYSFVLSNIPEITRYNVVENKNFSGGDQPGYVYTVIDDGTGSPTPELLAKALAAIETVRGLSIQNDVFPPTGVTVDLDFMLSISSLATQVEITAIVSQVLTAYVNTLPFNSILMYTKFFELIYNASPFILNVESLLVNGGTADITSNENTIFVIGNIIIGYL